MPASYKIDKERRLVMSCGASVVTREDIWGHMDRLSKDPDFDPDFSQVLDYTQFISIDVEAEDMRQFAQRNIFSPHARRAFVVRDDVTFGLARMFQILRELNGEKGIGVFRTFDEAVEWILVGNPAL